MAMRVINQFLFFLMGTAALAVQPYNVLFIVSPSLGQGPVCVPSSLPWRWSSPRWICHGMPEVVLSMASSDGSLGVRRSQKSGRHNKKSPSQQHRIQPNSYLSKSNQSNRSKERTVVILYNKPPNVITSHSNADEVSVSSRGAEGESLRRTVYEDITSMKGFVDSVSSHPLSFEHATGIKSKLHAIGRLDAATTGLLLLTNDGALVHRITNPTSKDWTGNGSDANSLQDEKSKPIQKTYEAIIMGNHNLPHDGENSSDNSTYPLLTLIQQGVCLPKKYGGQTRPVDELKILGHPTRTTTLVEVTISEGKNRQIRRMFHAIGSGVMQLHRKRVGNLNLQGLTDGLENDNVENMSRALKEGEWRLLSDAEVAKGLGWKCRFLNDEIHGAARRPQHHRAGASAKHRQRRAETKSTGRTGRQTRKK